MHRTFLQMVCFCSVLALVGCGGGETTTSPAPAAPPSESPTEPHAIDMQAPTESPASGAPAAQSEFDVPPNLDATAPAEPAEPAAEPEFKLPPSAASE